MQDYIEIDGHLLYEYNLPISHRLGCSVMLLQSTITQFGTITTPSGTCVISDSGAFVPRTAFKITDLMNVLLESIQYRIIYPMPTQSSPKFLLNLYLQGLLSQQLHCKEMEGSISHGLLTYVHKISTP